MNKYSQVRELLEKYSTFNKKTLGQVLAELTSIYKQEEYISYSATIKYYIMYNNSLHQHMINEKNFLICTLKIIMID